MPARPFVVRHPWPYLLGLFAAVAVGTAGPSAATALWLEMPGGWPAWPWLLPPVYLLAWFVLSDGSLPRGLASWTLCLAVGAALGAALAFAAVVAAFGGLPVAGGYAVVALAIGVGAATGAAVGFVADLSEDGWTHENVGRSRINRACGAVAGAGMGAWLFLPAAAPWAVAVALAWHGWASARWAALPRLGPVRPVALRAAVLAAVGYLVPSVTSQWLAPDRNGLAWPLSWREVARERADATDAERRFWGGDTAGRSLDAGQRVGLRIGDGGLVATVPEGWLGRADLVAWWPIGASPADWLELRRDPRTADPASVLRSVRIWPRGWGDVTLAAASPSGPPFVATRAGVPSVLGCDLDADWTGGAVPCRRYHPHLRDDAASARVPAEAVDAWVAFDPPHGLYGALVVLGRDFRAGCFSDPTWECRARLPLGGEASVDVSFAFDDLPRWRELRAEVDAVVFRATSRHLGDRPSVLQPQGVVLPLP